MVLNCAGETRKRDVTTMFTYSHANTPLAQSERAYYLSYFIKTDNFRRFLRNTVDIRSKVAEGVHLTVWNMNLGLPRKQVSRFLERSLVL